jgi:hypothetical protein
MPVLPLLPVLPAFPPLELDGRPIVAVTCLAHGDLFNNSWTSSEDQSAGAF